MSIKCAVEKIKNYDLIFCGRQAIDGDTAQVGPQLAEKLGINQLSCVSNIKEIDEKTITATRSTEYGHETLKSRYPVLITVTGEANEPRTPSAKKVMTYKNITTNSQSTSKSENTIKEWNTESIDADPLQCGLSGSPTKVKLVQNVVLTTQNMKEIKNDDSGISSLINELSEEHIIG